MTNEEVNQIIAEFMGVEFDIMPCGESACTFPAGGMKSKLIYSYYTSSLDALVPVWEKLDIYEHFALDMKNKQTFIWQEGNHSCGWWSYESKADTIQESAARTTAMMIKDLK